MSLPDPTAPSSSHRYISNAGEDIREMLAVIGVDSIDELFETIPDDVKLKGLLDIPGPWSEIETRRWFRGLAARNVTTGDHVSFLGGGAYAHYQPACIDQLLLRSEFLTAYTPYQPEVSQGTLQSIFEYQTHQCLLTGLDVANASLYDGSTALCEAVLMAERLTKGKTKVVLARSIHPHYRDTVRTYIQNLGIEIVEVGWGADGRIDLDELRAATDGAFAIAVQSPNFLGVIEDYDAVTKAVPDLTKIAVVAEATSFGILAPPGQHGFDICVGEGQAWGIPTQFGGPYVGFMVVREALKRHMPGRLVGETVDVDGKRAYVLTLATREQHIRRGKATSNICTNEALIALAANIYLSLMGKVGLREVATQCVQKTAYLRQAVQKIASVELPFSGPVYNELVVRTPYPAVEILKDLEHEKILGGIPLGEFFEGSERDFLVAVTELHTREQLDQFAVALSAAISRERR
ncbi:MAG TPA: aminomethyl-transferring glycine dehydrogenase subunit GcvPA [Thermoanaerobaculia bacterium]|jgi:glycine dehydrogenase subunit 1|nr:aminomethyl-transferring glycine dehydrogenase subunit GcvPA [Thermoanaerobaculia bacterium]